MDTPIRYKGFALIDGKLYSTWAGRTIGTKLTYKEGQITYTPLGSLGIWTYLTVPSREQCSCPKEVSFVVHEVIPLGEEFPIDVASAFSKSPGRYPAVLVDKEVYRETLPSTSLSVGSWVDVTKECTFEPHQEGNPEEGGYVLCVWYKGSLIAHVFKDGVESRVPARCKIVGSGAWFTVYYFH